MKNYEKLSWLVMVALLLVTSSACEKKDWDDYNMRDVEAINGSLTTDEFVFVVNDSEIEEFARSFITGHGFLDASESIEINSSLSHFAYYQDSPEGNVKIQQGQFEYVTASGDSFFGIYCGCGSYDGENICCEVKMTVTGGTGRYFDAAGVITANIDHNDLMNADNMKLVLKGNILLAPAGN